METSHLIALFSLFSWKRWWSDVSCCLQRGFWKNEECSVNHIQGLDICLLSFPRSIHLVDYLVCLSSSPDSWCFLCPSEDLSSGGFCSPPEDLCSGGFCLPPEDPSELVCWFCSIMNLKWWKHWWIFVPSRPWISGSSRWSCSTLSWRMLLWIQFH